MVEADEKYSQVEGKATNFNFLRVSSRRFGSRGVQDVGCRFFWRGGGGGGRFFSSLWGGMIDCVYDPLETCQGRALAEKGVQMLGLKPRACLVSPMVSIRGARLADVWLHPR